MIWTVANSPIYPQARQYSEAPHFHFDVSNLTLQFPFIICTDTLTSFVIISKDIAEGRMHRTIYLTPKPEDFDKIDNIFDALPLDHQMIFVCPDKIFAYRSLSVCLHYAQKQSVNNDW